MSAGKSVHTVRIVREIARTIGNNSLDEGNQRTVNRTADANTDNSEPQTVRNNHFQNNKMAAADGADASSPPYSIGWRARL